jgi:hypothetical protein
VCILAYGDPADRLDEYICMGESTILECVIQEYRDVYLREPNAEDIARLLEVTEQEGFPGMLDSIDCIH